MGTRRNFHPALLLSAMLLAPPAAAAGFTVKEGRLLDANGLDFVMRGVNFPHAWFSEETARSLPHIAATGANAVRVVLATGGQWEKTPASELEDILRLCEALDLVAIVEVHDCTGYPESEEAVPIEEAVAYWVEMKELLFGREATVILNIANEPLGNTVPDDAWVTVHREAIAALREAGFRHTLMVDAANWAQDWRGITLREAPQVFAADPLQNTVFSVHMYDVYGTEGAVRAYLEAFLEHELPLVVGEFAADHGPGNPVAEEAIMKWCDHYGLGYLGWSWSGNAGNLDSLDIVLDFDPARLSAWGETLINGPHGIRATARPASVFAD